jgi:hypothetical protein
VLCEAQANGDAAAIAALHKMVEQKVELKADQFARLGIDLADANKTDAALEVVAVARRSSRATRRSARSAEAPLDASRRSSPSRQHRRHREAQLARLPRQRERGR